jgi:glucosylceramidase
VPYLQRFFYFSCVLFSCFSSAIADHQVQVWQSTADGSKKLAEQNSFPFDSEKKSHSFEIKIHPEQTFQMIEGFGASLTDSSSWLLKNLKNSNPEAYNKLLHQLFSRKEGIALNLLRQPMGATDFSLKLYSFADPDGQVVNANPDPELKSFSIEYDKENIIPAVQDALKVNPEIKIIGSSWSAPGWMKNSGSMIGGSLLNEYYPTYANYFLKFIDAYESVGIPIHAVTIQNESGWTPPGYPGMLFNATEQGIFIKDHLGPAFDGHTFPRAKPKIFALDDQWETEARAHETLSDTQVKSYTSGIGFHCYAGNPSNMSSFHEKFPNLTIYVSECASGVWIGTDYASYLKSRLSSLIIPSLLNWAQGILMWPVALDSKFGPGLPPPPGATPGCPTCTGPAKIDQKADSTWDYSLDHEYYVIGHASKFIHPGAYRVGSELYQNGTVQEQSGPLQQVAIKNPDGSLVLIMYNTTDKAEEFAVKVGEEEFSYTIEAGGALTFQWEGPKKN